MLRLPLWAEAGRPHTACCAKEPKRGETRTARERERAVKERRKFRRADERYARVSEWVNCGWCRGLLAAKEEEKGARVRWHAIVCVYYSTDDVDGGWSHSRRVDADIGACWGVRIVSLACVFGLVFLGAHGFSQREHSHWVKIYSKCTAVYHGMVLRCDGGKICFGWRNSTAAAAGEMIVDYGEMILV